MSEEAGHVKFPLRLKLFFFGALLAVGPTVAVGIGLMEINATTLETQNRELRLTVAEDIAESIETTLSRAHESLLGLQQVLTNEALSDEIRIELVTALVEADPLLDTVGVYGRDGAYIAQIDQAGRSFDKDELETSVAETAANKTLAIGGVERRDGSVWVETIIAIRPRPNEVTGFLRTRAPLAGAQERVLELAKLRLSSDSRIDVLATDGTVLLSTAVDELGEKIETEGMLSDLETVVRQGVAHSGEHPSRDVLVSARPLRSLPWVTRVEVPLDVAYESLYTMRLVVLIATTAAALVALILALFFSNRLTRPLDAVVDFTRQLAARAFDARVEVETTDEIALVARSLNDAAANLQASEEQIAREIAIRSDLGRYLPEELVDNVVRREQIMELGGERREITVLFADVVRFTPLCEHHPPEVVVSILNELFTLLTTIIFESGGTVDKFIGDCVMAFWGAPREDEDHAFHALEAAEKMTRLMEFANSRWMKDHGIEVELAIGVNTGDAVIGNIGSETRMEYTAIGQVVNQAARLEALARPGQVLVTEEVRQAVTEFGFRPISTELLSVGGDEAEVYEVVF